ncbi:MAG: imidazoleglycerol-phosphate dehydratase HisB [Planctomycetaceae bacterium]|jgi:imidazoleglycerol-phosphate dehydratase|nr:imidazoleglycerol-phosphate dehydratase HisB [Planctomycetaceae bacterium]
MTLAPRIATVSRDTKETQISLTLNLDGTGTSDIATGLGFFDHMLTLFSAHSLIDLTLHCSGDLHVDGHHTVEDTGIVLGQAFAEALGDKTGLRRFGHFTLPMDETLATVAVDFSGRACLVYHVDFQVPQVGHFDTELVHEFWQGFAQAAKCTLHLTLHYGTNGHHIAESLFKAAARAMRMAVEIDPRQQSIPSTKGML